MENRSFQLKDEVRVTDSTGRVFASGVVVGRTIEAEPYFDVATDSEVLLYIKEDRLRNF